MESSRATTSLRRPKHSWSWPINVNAAAGGTVVVVLHWFWVEVRGKYVAENGGK